MEFFQKNLQLLKTYSSMWYRITYLSSIIWFLSTAVAFAENPPAVAGGAPVKLINPLKIGSAEELLTTILGVVVILATPFIVFFIIYAGFLYVTARGNAEQVTKANRALTYAIIGGVIIIGSVAIATIVKNIVSTF